MLSRFIHFRVEVAQYDAVKVRWWTKRDFHLLRFLEGRNLTNATFANGHALLIGVGADLPVTVQDATVLHDALNPSAHAAYSPNQVIMSENFPLCYYAGGVRMCRGRLCLAMRKERHTWVLQLWSAHALRGVKTRA